MVVCRCHHSEAYWLMPKESFSLIGMYGGTFDPVHYGHLRLAEELNEMLGFDKLYIIPSGSPRLRNVPGASRDHRVAMLKAAIKDNEAFILDEREIDRAGDSYSIITLREYRQEVGERYALCFIVGSDVFLNFNKWYCWNEIFELCHIIIADRPGYLSVLNNRIPQELEEALRCRQASSVDDLKMSSHGLIFIAPTTLQDISATAIREYIAAKKSARYLTPDVVLEYIKTNHLYSGKK